MKVRRIPVPGFPVDWVIADDNTFIGALATGKNTTRYPYGKEFEIECKRK